MLFILSISAIFLYLIEKHPDVESISFVDDIGFALRCEELDSGIKKLESVA